MRHQVAGKHLNRTSSHRKALRRNLAASLFEHGTIVTTIQKAKFVRSFAEKLITLAKDGSLHARRRAISQLNNRNICKIEDGESVKETTVIQRLFDDIGPRFADRNGGYTRIIRLAQRRIGDNGQWVMLQLIGESEVVTEKVKAQVEQGGTPEVAPADEAPVEDEKTEEPQEEKATETEDDKK